MKNRFKKFLAFFLVLNFLFFTVRNANAFVPPPVITVIAAAASGAPFTMGTSLAIGGVMSLGALLYWVVTRDDGSQVRIPGGTALANAVPIPDATKTINAVLQTYYYAYGSGSCPILPAVTNAADACRSYIATCPASDRTYSFDYADSSYCHVTQHFPDGTTSGGIIYLSSSNSYCPSGYTYSGSVCNLIDARTAISDSKVDYRRIGSSFSKLPDVDTESQSRVISDVNPNDTVIYSGVDVNGNQRQVRFRANSDGSTLVSNQVQKVDANGKTYIAGETYAMDPYGVITSAYATNSTGYFDYDSTTKSYTISQSASGLPDATVASPNTQPTTFPSDYAKAGEAQSAATSIVTAVNAQAERLDSIDNGIKDLTKSSASPSDLVPADPSEFDNAFFKTTFDGLKAWRLPAHSSVCPTASLDLSVFFGAGHTYVMDQQCTLIENNRNALSVSMIVVWLLMALFIVMGA